MLSPSLLDPVSWNVEMSCSGVLSHVKTSHVENDSSKFKVFSGVKQFFRNSNGGFSFLFFVR